jgi:membrane associated rhomboid family serine protease
MGSATCARCFGALWTVSHGDYLYCVCNYGIFAEQLCRFGFRLDADFFLRGATLTIGASAPIFGLLGALVVYGRRGGSSHIGGQAMAYAVILFVFGFVMPNIDNYAHLGGFLGGYATALWLDPLKPERVDHVITAIICIGITALSILASVLSVRIA